MVAGQAHVSSRHRQYDAAGASHQSDPIPKARPDAPGPVSEPIFGVAGREWSPYSSDASDPRRLGGGYISLVAAPRACPGGFRKDYRGTLRHSSFLGGSLSELFSGCLEG